MDGGSIRRVEKLVIGGRFNLVGHIREYIKSVFGWGNVLR